MSYYIPSIQALPPIITQVVFHIPSIVKKTTISMLSFELISHVGYSIISAQALRKDKINHNNLIQESKATYLKVNAKVTEFFKNSIHEAGSFVVANALVFASSVLGAAAVLHKMKKINIGLGYNVCTKVSQGLFLASTIVTIDIYLNQFYSAQDILKSANESPERKNVAWHVRNSAVLAILNALSYLISGAIYLYGTSIALNIILAAAAITGVLKFLYDWVHSVPQSLLINPIQTV